MTRGELNNNPGNINYKVTQPFRGQIGIEEVPLGKGYAPRFGKYDTAQNGIRAIAKTLITYVNIDKADTVRKIINRWAPDYENHTIEYIYAVAKDTGMDPDTIVKIDQELLTKLVKAIIVHENGENIYSDETINLAVMDAMTPSNPHGVKI